MGPLGRTERSVRTGIRRRPGFAAARTNEEEEVVVVVVRAIPWCACRVRPWWGE